MGARLLPGAWLHGVLGTPWEGRTVLCCPWVWLSQSSRDPLLPLEVFFSSGHICSTQGPAQALTGIPSIPSRVHRSPLLRASGIPGSLLPASSRQSPRREAPSPLPHCFQGDLSPPEAALPQKWLYQGCHASVPVSVYPQQQQHRSGWLLRSWETKGRSKRCQGCTAWHDAGCPAPTPGTPLWGAGWCSADPHRTGPSLHPTATLSLGGAFPHSPRGGRWDGCWAVPTSLPLAAVLLVLVLVVVARPHCPRVPPRRSLRVLRAPAGPSHSSGYF